MEFVCECCRFKQEFEDEEAAFRAGWDAPPHFSSYVSCNLCPGSFVVLGKTHLHKSDHERWAKSGRPAEFEIPDVDKVRFPPSETVH